MIYYYFMIGILVALVSYLNSGYITKPTKKEKAVVLFVIALITLLWPIFITVSLAFQIKNRMEVSRYAKSKERPKDLYSKRH